MDLLSSRKSSSSLKISFPLRKVSESPTTPRSPRSKISTSPRLCAVCGSSSALLNDLIPKGSAQFEVYKCKKCCPNAVEIKLSE